MSEPTKAVFLSYASQDAEAAKRIADALRAAGVEVWFDAEGGLEHGDEWDAKIRRQIKECVLFLPIISANTQAREEGYFRIEWELAAQRALGIASGVAFILPVLIDGTREPDALVPDRFRTVQWTKLPGGNVPPEVLQRFLKLWSHRTGALKHEATVGRDHPIPPDSGKAGFGDPALQSKRRTAWPWVFLGLVAIAAGYLIFKPRHSPEEVARIVADAQKLATAVTPPAPAVPPVSEARQLVARARALAEALDCTRDDFKLAEELITQAKARDPMDAEVSAAESQLHGRYISRGWDVSDARREAERAAAQRAIRLDPQSFEARLAQAGLLADSGSEATEKERQLRELRRERPTDKRVLRMLAAVLDRAERTDESAAIADESAALPGGDPVALYSKSLGFWFSDRTVEAETAIQASLAQQPFAGALLIAAWYRIALHGDLEGARGFLTRIQPAQMIEDRAAFFAFYLEYLAHRPDAAIARLQAVPRDWLSDFWYRGPKGWLVGDALEMAGRHDAALLEWTAALKLVEQRLAANPSNANLIYNRTGLLLELGRREEAEQQLALLRQLGSAIDISSAGSIVKCAVLLGHKAEAIKGIAAALKRRSHAVVFSSGVLRLDPRYDPLRGDPEFTQLIAEAEALEQAANPAVGAAPPPPDWPRDPDLKRAMKLLNSPEAIVSDVVLAEDIVKTVLAAHPTDPEGTLAMGRVQVYYLLRGFDRSEERFAAAKHYAERALALTPDDPEAMAVMATYLYRRNVEMPRAQKLIRQAITLRPTEPLYYRILDNVLANTPGVGDAEIIAAARVTADRFPQDALVQYELARHYRDAGMLEECEHYLDVAIKLGPVANAIIARARLMIFAHGDPAGMKAILDQLPERYQGTDRAVFSQFSYAMVTGQPQLGLDVLQATPEAWMIDFDYTGPTALLQGELLLQQGKPELARLRFTEALAELGRHKAILERNFSTTWLETWLLMRLGRPEEARKRNDVFFPELTRPFRMGLGTNWWFNPITQNLLLGEHTKALDLIREMADFQRGRTILRNALRLDPRMAPFRDDPEIQAILADPAATGSDSSSAKATEDWSGKASTPDQKSVAVLAFANLSDDKANEYFSDGISEELLNVLAKVPKLKVAARTSSFYFKGRNEPIPEIAQKLGVAYVLEGSVRKAGNKVRITAQLIKAADGFHVWSETYDRDLTDIFAVQDEIAKNILGVVKGSLFGEAELPHATTTKIEAYTLYLQAQGAFAKRGEANLREAVRLFKAALAIDPDYVPALVGLAQASVVLPNYAFVSGATAREITDGATQAARRALQLDPQNAAAQAVIGWAAFQFDWRWEEGLAGMFRARDLAPNDSWTWNCLGDCHRFAGDLVQALKDKQRAWELDPLSPNSHWDLSYTYLVAGRYAESIHWANLAIAMAPRNLDSYMPGLLAAGRAGRFDEMHRMLALAWQNMQEAEGMLRVIEANCAILENKPGEARRLLALASTQVEAGNASPAYLGYCYLLLGDSEPAARWLQRGLERSDEALIWNEVIDFEVVAANPKTRPILDHPRLKELREIRQRNARAGLNKL